MKSKESEASIALMPISGLTQSGSDSRFWVATDEDPQFELSLCPGLAGGWVRFSAEIEPTGPWTSSPVIYIDRGAGYRESDKVVLAAPEGQRHKAELILFLPPTATRLRFDPLAQAGPFRAEAPRLERLGKLRAGLAMCSAVAGRSGWKAVFQRATRAAIALPDQTPLRGFRDWLVSSYLSDENRPAIPMSSRPRKAPQAEVTQGLSSSTRQPERIQVHRRNALGDVLLVTPILQALRKQYRTAQITVSTLYPAVFDHNPNVYEVLRSEGPLPGFDLTIDLQYEYFPEMHIVDAYAQIAEVKVEDKTPEFHLARADLAAADEVLRQAGVDPNQPVVAFHMESGWKVRDWPLHRFRAVAAWLQARGAQVVVLGERPTLKVDFGIDLRGKTGVRSLAGVIFKSDALVSIDSGLMHLAASIRRPFVGLFGCTDPEKRVPDWARSSAIYAEIVCHGCHHRQRPVPITTAPVCPFETVRCMDEIQVEQVTEKLNVLLESTSRPVVSIVIPHYRHYEVLDRCLSSLFRIGASVPFEVIVVDDSGTGEDAASITAWAPRVRLIRNPQNVGFSRSCNAGVRAARGEFVVLLNNDTTVTRGWLDHMLALYASDSRVAIVGPKLLYPDSEAIQHCGTVINEMGVAEHIYRCLPGNLAGANRVRRFRALTGACMLMRRKDLLDVGGLDEAYRNGGEDTDLCFSMLAAGRTLLYCPQSVVYHHEGYSRGLRDLEHPDDLYNRERLRQRWGQYLVPDISDYCLLAEIEAAEGRTWQALDEVPADLRTKHDTPEARSVGRYPYKCEIGSGMNPQASYLHLDVIAGAPSLDILHDVSRPLPFLDGTVGEILANHVIEHVSWRSLPNLVADLGRVMAPGGKAFIRTPNLRFIAERFLSGQLTPEYPDDERAMREGFGNMTPGLWANIKLFSGQDYPSNFHFNCMDPQDLVQLFRKAGFANVKLEQFGREFSPGEIQLVAEK